MTGPALTFRRWGCWAKRYWLENFCCAMLWISAAYAVNHAVSVCPSIRLSCLCILWKETNTSSNFFRHRVATPLYIVHTKPYDSIPTGPLPLTGASKQGYDKIAIFDRCLVLSWKWYKIGPYLPGTPIGTRVWSVELCHFQWPWMTLTRIPRSHLYLTLTISQTVQDRGIIATGLTHAHSSVSLRMTHE